MDVDSGSVRIGAECSQLIEQLRIIADNPGQVAVADDGIWIKISIQIEMDEMDEIDECEYVDGITVGDGDRGSGEKRLENGGVQWRHRVKVEIDLRAPEITCEGGEVGGWEGGRGKKKKKR